ncbi:MAG: protein kinase [Sandaracinaceae bacterium]
MPAAIATGLLPAPTRSGEGGSSFRRLCVIAEGGMGEVELVAREEGRFRRLYAVKRLRESLRNEPELRSMFLEEARIAGLVRHANVVSVLDVGEDHRGPFLVMDYIDGISVADLIIACSAAGIDLPLQIGLQIAIQAARGLHAAHELTEPSGRRLGIVHRDVSPQNLLIGLDGITRVSDFGIAKALGATHHTATGIVKGKLGYVSPEQLKFEEPDRRSDIFSLGIVLFELLTGRRLYKSSDGHDGPRRILGEAPPDLGDYRADAPPALVELTFSMLAKRPDQRPATAKRVADALEAIWLEETQQHGAMDVGHYITEAFASLLADRRDQLERAIAAEHTAYTPASPSTATHVRTTRSRGAIVLGGVAVLGLGLSIVGYVVTQRPADVARPVADQPAEVGFSASGGIQGTRSEALPDPAPTPNGGEASHTALTSTPDGADALDGTAAPEAPVADAPSADRTEEEGTPADAPVARASTPPRRRPRVPAPRPLTPEIIPLGSRPGVSSSVAPPTRRVAPPRNPDLLPLD